MNDDQQTCLYAADGDAALGRKSHEFENRCSTI
jgi:hypothetical protein